MPTVALPTGTISVDEYDLTSVADASTRLAQGNEGMSEHEYTAAAIVNGRLDLLAQNYREAMIRMGKGWAHATVEVIFDHWEREMALRPDNPACPIGDQRIFTRNAD